jgi:hypothetical protein
VYPYADWTAFFRPSDAVIVTEPIEPVCPPKSNGMIVQPSMVSPAAAPSTPDLPGHRSLRAIEGCQGHILMKLSSAGQDELTGYWYAVRP